MYPAPSCLVCMVQQVVCWPPPLLSFAPLVFLADVALQTPRAQPTSPVVKAEMPLGLHHSRVALEVAQR
jgi:hypothetical protein